MNRRIEVLHTCLFFLNEVLPFCKKKQVTVVVKTIGDDDDSSRVSDGREEGFFVEWLE
jgi:hypothetical protein